MSSRLTLLVLGRGGGFGQGALLRAKLLSSNVKFGFVDFNSLISFISARFEGGRSSLKVVSCSRDASCSITGLSGVAWNGGRVDEN